MLRVGAIHSTRYTRKVLIMLQSSHCGTPSATIIQQHPALRARTKCAAALGDSSGASLLAACPHLRVCSGCSITDAPTVSCPPVFAAATSFFDSVGVLLEPTSVGPSVGYRKRAKLAVRDCMENNMAQVKIGLFEQGSHRVIEIPHCLVHDPMINLAAASIESAMKSSGLRGYNEASRSGHLRYLQLTVDARGRVQVVLVWNAKRIGELPVEKLKKFRDELVSTRGSPAMAMSPSRRLELHSLWNNFQPDRSNVIFGESWQLVQGEEEMWLQFQNTAVCIFPSSFCQANMDMFDRLLQDLLAHIDENTSVIDLYSGVGVIGLCVANNCKVLRVDCVDSNPYAHLAFERSKHKLGPEAVIDFITDSLEDEAVLQKWISSYHTCIVDPPRKGLSSKLLSLLVSLDGDQSSLEKLIYVSCGYQSFERDATKLLQSGKWALKYAKPYIFFPGTDSIELLAVFKRTA